MDVFISWSGAKSREVAVTLREWLPSVINSVRPFVSSKDIDAGARWQMEVATRLESTNFGIVCVTKDNQRQPWLNFEAGALAKAVDASRVAPLAIDLKPSDIALPLGQFHAQPATETGLAMILGSLNAACPTPLPEGLLKKAVDKWWPDLSAELKRIDEQHERTSAVAEAGRSDRELLEETLNTVRSLARRRSTAADGDSIDIHTAELAIARILDMLGDQAPEEKAAVHRRGQGLLVVTTHELPDRLEGHIEQVAAQARLPITFGVTVAPSDKVGWRLIEQRDDGTTQT